MSRIIDDELILPPISAARQLPGQTRLPRLINIASSRGSNPDQQEKMDYSDTGCIITRVHRHTDEMAHIVNAQRSNKDMKGELVS